jgi:hypothetical protein
MLRPPRLPLHRAAPRAAMLPQGTGEARADRCHFAEAGAIGTQVGQASSTVLHCSASTQTTLSPCRGNRRRAHPRPPGKRRTHQRRQHHHLRIARDQIVHEIVQRKLTGPAGGGGATGAASGAPGPLHRLGRIGDFIEGVAPNAVSSASRGLGGDGLAGFRPSPSACLARASRPPVRLIELWFIDLP